MDRDKMCNLLERTAHRCSLPSFGSFGQTHILIFFLANLAKGNMSFCHHLVSVVCHPFTFHSGFRGEDFLKIGQSETRISCGGHVW
jgi:hypothetical protein